MSSSSSSSSSSTTSVWRVVTNGPEDLVFDTTEDHNHVLLPCGCILNTNNGQQAHYNPGLMRQLFSDDGKIRERTLGKSHTHDCFLSSSSIPSPAVAVPKLPNNWHSVALPTRLGHGCSGDVFAFDEEGMFVVKVSKSTHQFESELKAQTALKQHLSPEYGQSLNLYLAFDKPSLRFLLLRLSDSLESYLARKETYFTFTAAHFETLFNAIKNMHLIGVAHHDVKLKNIMINRGKKCLVLIDFDISRRADHDLKKKDAHDLLGVASQLLPSPSRKELEEAVNRYCELIGPAKIPVPSKIAPTPQG